MTTALVAITNYVFRIKIRFPSFLSFPAPINTYGLIFDPMNHINQSGGKK